MRAAERSEFLPPAEPGLMRSVGLALLAHAVLVLALSWGLKWKRDDQNVAVEAELWSSTVQQAAPKPQEAPPPPPPPPAPAPAPAVQPPPPPVQREADIALERDRRRAAQEKARQEEADRQRQQAERRREEQARRQEQAKEQARKAAEDRRREEQAKAKAQQQEAERLAKMREENLRRIQGLAGATGVREATGTATRSAGPTDSYAGRIRARVRPNIVFTDDISGNPSTEVEVRMAPDGTIIGTKVTRPSGAKSWDDAVVRALERTGSLPRDIDGRVHSPLLIEFRPKG